MLDYQSVELPPICTSETYHKKLIKRKLKLYLLSEMLIIVIYTITTVRNVS